MSDECNKHDENEEIDLSTPEELAADLISFVKREFPDDNYKTIGNLERLKSSSVKMRHIFHKSLILNKRSRLPNLI